MTSINIGNCPTCGKRCRTCNRKNQFAVCCSRSSIKRVSEQDISSDNYSDAGNDDFFIDMVKVKNPNPSTAQLNCRQQLKHANSQINDTRSDWSVTLDMTWKELMSISRLTLVPSAMLFQNVYFITSHHDQSSNQ